MDLNYVKMNIYQINGVKVTVRRPVSVTFRGNGYKVYQN